MKEREDFVPPYPLLIKHLLANSAQIAGSNGISYGATAYSYAQFVTRVKRLAGLLFQAGVRAGDTVAVMDWDSHRYLECYFAIPALGASLQTVNVRIAREQIAFTLADTGAKALIYNEDFLPLLRDVGGCLAGIGIRILIGESGRLQPSLSDLGEYETLIEASEPLESLPDFDENTRATVFHTSGTTGRPKGVQFSHRQIVLQTLALAAMYGMQPAGFDINRTDVYMPLTPMFHVHAWGFPYMATMMGLSQVYPGRYEPRNLVRLKQHHGVTFSHCVPSVLQMVLEAAEQMETRLDGWKIVIGGSALTASLRGRAVDRGINAFAGYGMSETCPLVSVSHERAAGVSDLLEAGCLAPMVYAAVEGADKVLSVDGGPGELVLRTPWLTQGYLNRPDASRALWANGWLHTQDVAHIKDGAIQIVDRLKDVIKTGGEWVSSIEVENLLASLPGVDEVVVIGVPDARWGERPIAVGVARAAGVAFSHEALRAHLCESIEAGRISSYAVPDRFVVVDKLPRTSVGKIDKKILRELVTELL